MSGQMITLFHLRARVHIVEFLLNFSMTFNQISWKSSQECGGIMEFSQINAWNKFAFEKIYCLLITPHKSVFIYHKEEDS